MKRFLIIALLICTLLAAGCSSNQADTLTQAEAQNIAIEELGVARSDVSEVHIHVEPYEGTPAYNIHVTVGDHAYEVIVDAVTGAVLHKGDSSH